MSENGGKRDFSDVDLRRLDLTRKYDEGFGGDGVAGWRDHLMLYVITGLVGFFILWASFASVDEVARGDGTVIPTSQVQVIQNLEGGIVDAFLVNEGDAVKEGQVILRMRNVQARADLGATNQKYLGLVAAVARLEAEAEGREPVFPPEAVKDAPESVAAERAAFSANEKQVSDQRSVLDQQKEQKEQEVAELQRRISDISGVLRLTRDERDMVAPMVARGASARMELLQLDRQIAEKNAELNGLKLALPRAQGAVKEAGQRLAELESGRRADARKDLSEKTVELNAIRESLAAFEDKSARTEIRSPVAGTVKDIKLTTVGGVVRPGEPIMEIVPLEDRLIVEARVRPADIAFIHPGQRAMVRLTAFDFSIYGAMEGTVSDISADSITNEKGESFYRVRIATQGPSMEKNGKTYEIIPGMQASVDIVTGRKTVMNYLLKPFNKAARTALRER